MTRTELQEIGKAILDKKKELICEKREDWELCRYSISEAYEEAIKEICLLQ